VVAAVVDIAAEAADAEAADAAVADAAAVEAGDKRVIGEKIMNKTKETP
jgi:hypothetical protein